MVILYSVVFNMNILIKFVRLVMYTTFLYFVGYVCLIGYYKYNSETHIFNKYISEMIEDSKGKLSSNDFDMISFNIINMDYPVIGLCHPLTGHIEFNKNYWYYHSTKLERRILFYHEVAHCVMDQGHREGDMEDLCPTSIMNSYSPTDECIKDHYNHYMDELFSQDK